MFKPLVMLAGIGLVTQLVLAAPPNNTTDHGQGNTGNGNHGNGVGNTGPGNQGNGPNQNSGNAGGSHDHGGSGGSGGGSGSGGGNNGSGGGNSSGGGSGTPGTTIPITSLPSNATSSTVIQQLIITSGGQVFIPYIDPTEEARRGTHIDSKLRCFDGDRKLEIVHTGPAYPWYIDGPVIEYCDDQLIYIQEDK